MYVNALQESVFLCLFLYIIYLSKIAVKDIELSSLCWKVKCKVQYYFLESRVCFYLFGWYIKLL